MLSVIAGKWKGRRLRALQRDGLRPSSSRVKASMFSALESWAWKKRGNPGFSSWRCLDLFAGVGGLGIEVLSRGAESCVFVEKDPATLKVLKDNLSGLGLPESCFRILRDDVFHFSWQPLGPFELIVMDPPYAQPGIEALLKQIAESRLLCPGGALLLEHDPALRFVSVPGLKLESARILGPAGISLFSYDA